MMIKPLLDFLPFCAKGWGHGSFRGHDAVPRTDLDIKKAPSFNLLPQQFGSCISGLRIQTIDGWFGGNVGHRRCVCARRHCVIVRGEYGRDGADRHGAEQDEAEHHDPDKRAVA